MTLDHIVIFVRDLEQAVEDYTVLGFHVEPGGQHARTENALIIFADGSYLELLALQKNWKRPLIRLAAKLGLVARSADKSSDMYGRLLRWICSGTGIIDWCAGTEDMAATMALWEKELNDTLGYQAFDRTRPDGKVAKWYLGGARSFDLPFLIEDITPREIRVPPVGRDAHPNGAMSIVELSLPVDDPEAMTELYETLGLSSLPVILVARQDHQDITLKIAISSGKTYTLNKRQTHGAHIELVQQDV